MRSGSAKGGRIEVAGTVAGVRDESPGSMPLLGSSSSSTFGRPVRAIARLSFLLFLQSSAHPSLNTPYFADHVGVKANLSFLLWLQLSDDLPS